MDNIFLAAHWIVFDFRCTVGLWLLRRAMRWMPNEWSMRQAVDRGIGERVVYDRYAAYCRVMNQQPLPFPRWREQYQWMKTRPAGKSKVVDRYRRLIVRESEIAPL